MGTELNKLAFMYLDQVQDKKAHVMFMLDDLLHNNYRSKNNLASFYYCYSNFDIANKKEFYRVKRLYEQSARNKDNVIANYMLGRLYYDKREYKKAYKSFRDAFRLKRSPAMLFNIGVCLFEMRQKQKALNVFQKLGKLESIPFIEEVQIANLIVLSSMKNYDEARKFFHLLKSSQEKDMVSLMDYAYICKDEQFIKEHSSELTKWICEAGGVDASTERRIELQKMTEFYN